MISIVILGAGNVAFHLTNELLKHQEIKLLQVYNRSIAPIKYLENKTEITTDINSLKNADIYIIAVTDDAIESISSKINYKDKLVVHTSGSVAITNLKTSANKGVFYPLQTFSKDKNVNFRNIPICIEAINKKDMYLLKKLGNILSDNVLKINSDQREKLHVAAVFVNNFVNHLYKIGSDICNDNNIPFTILHPLILETAKKIEYLNPDEAQTGPAKRKDSNTLKKQELLLKEQQKEIYQTLTHSILKSYEKKL